MRALLRILLLGSAAVAAGCSTQTGPSCSSEDAKAAVQKLLWGELEQQFVANVGPQNVSAFLALARKHLSVELSGVATSETSASAKAAKCQATMVTVVPDSLKADLGQLQTALAKESGGARLQGKTLTSQLEYRVVQSDDKQTTRVEARGFRTHIEVMGGIAHALYVEAAAPPVNPTAPSGNDVVAGLSTAQRSGTANSSSSEQLGQDPQSLAESEFQAADGKLNQAYRDALARLDASAQSGLRDRQRAWIKERDANCSESKIAADTGGVVAGGRMMVAEILACRTRQTEARAAEIAKVKG